MKSVSRRMIGLCAMTGATLVSGCAGYGQGPSAGYGPPSGQPYYADQYYRDGPSYRERRLRRNDAVYRGRDGRYYCKRNDGTTGLIVGALAGGVLGNIIAPGGSKTLGTLLGAGGGGLAGRAIGRNDARCR
ncbi:hypothetical protein [Sphingomonas sp. CROZ-RG-20F-R02-07]|uniref:hypothetical protein n=1 Tax=Sphingomonas sp. CROZ-RG-20F-R02-07 TaxID=2914832 RepID=UPI001F57A1EA|nr:hypothetical protein [Sphingomonas sp. CROZ-RG-20F-R02-07]